MKANRIHRQVHLGAIALALVALPWSESLLSISQLLLVGNWLWEGAATRTLVARFKHAFTAPESAVFLSFFGLHLLGLAWTSDLQWGLDLCRILLPVWVFGAEDLAFDITVLPLHALRQAPLSSVDERPMRRASLAQLRQLLAEDEIAGYEGGLP